MIKEESILFLTIAAAGFILCRIPHVGKVLRVFNTLFHEGGHALAAWFTSGEVLKIELFHDTSGTTITKSNARRSQIIVSLAGYVFASFIPWVFILLLSYGYEIVLHITMFALSITLLLLAVRNTYGIIWILVMLGVYFLIIFKIPDYSWILTYLYTGIMLFEGLFSAITICNLSFSKPNNAGDATNLQKYTIFPVWFWGVFFVAQAFIFFILSLYLLIK